LTLSLQTRCANVALSSVQFNAMSQVVRIKERVEEKEGIPPAQQR
jgi:hypothetical protein